MLQCWIFVIFFLVRCTFRHPAANTIFPYFKYQVQLSIKKKYLFQIHVSMSFFCMISAWRRLLGIFLHVKYFFWHSWAIASRQWTRTGCIENTMTQSRQQKEGTGPLSWVPWPQRSITWGRGLTSVCSTWTTQIPRSHLLWYCVPTAFFETWSKFFYVVLYVPWNHFFQIIYYFIVGYLMI